VRIEIDSEPALEHLTNVWRPAAGDDRTPSDGTGLKIRSLADIPSVRDFGAREIEYVVGGMIAAGTVTAITGDSGAGKSTFVTALCGAVAEGKPFAGFATQQRPVLILDRENPAQIVVERLDRLHVAEGKNLRIWGGWLPEKAPAPFSPMIVNLISASDPKPLIVVDSLISFHGGNENDASETRAYMQSFRRLADMGATVIVLRHSGKGGSSKEYRGSSDIKASIDAGYLLTNVGSDPSRLEHLRLKVFKARFNVLPEVLLRCRDGRFELEGGGPERSASERLSTLLANNAGITGKSFEELAGQNGVPRNCARAFLKDGIEARRVEVTLGRRNARFHRLIA
jgi:archaellum biogenesis ATPase FlaH